MPRQTVQLKLERPDQTFPNIITLKSVELRRSKSLINVFHGTRIPKHLVGKQVFGPASFAGGTRPTQAQNENIHVLCTLKKAVSETLKC